MGPELDLYLLPEDKGLKITTMGRETEREGRVEIVEESPLQVSHPGSSVARVRKAPDQTPGRRHREHEEGAKEDEQSGKQCPLFTVARQNLTDAADREDTLFSCVCDGRHVSPAGTAVS